jgi:response regulator NasT
MSKGLPKTALIVEDNVDHADLLAEAVSGTGIQQIERADSFASAHDISSRVHFDINLVDQNLKDGDQGFSVACSLWSIHRTPSILVTAAAPSDLLQSGVPDGVFGYLVKPVSPEQAEAALRIAWAKYQEIDEHEHSVAELSQKLKQRKVIEHAKWQLVARYGLTEPEAHRSLQHRARSEQRPIMDTAIDVLRELSIQREA